MRRRFLLCLAVAAVVCGSPTTTSAAGPNALSGPIASPTSGTTVTPFSLSVSYQGGFPALAVTASVAGLSLPMQLGPGSPTDGRWSVTTLLPPGSWPTTFRATASQGKQPSAAGPIITVQPATAPTTARPTMIETPAAVGSPSDESGGAPPPATAAPAAPVATDAPAGEPEVVPVPPSGAPAPPTAEAGQPTPVPGDEPASPASPIDTAARVGPSSPGWRGTPGAASPRQGEGLRPSASDPVATGFVRTDTPNDPAAPVLPIAAFAGLVLLAGALVVLSRRRSAQEAAGADGTNTSGLPEATADAVAAALHRRMIRRARMPLDDEPIGSAATTSTKAGVRPARRRPRR